MGEDPGARPSVAAAHALALTKAVVWQTRIRSGSFPANSAGLFFFQVAGSEPPAHSFSEVSFPARRQFALFGWRRAWNNFDISVCIIIIYHNSRVLCSLRATRFLKISHFFLSFFSRRKMLLKIGTRSRSQMWSTAWSSTECLNSERHLC